MTAKPMLYIGAAILFLIGLCLLGYGLLNIIGSTSGQGAASWLIFGLGFSFFGVLFLAGGAGMSRTISTQGFSSVTLVIYLGAKSYEGAEQLKLSWWDGATWRVLTVIRNGTARENGKLNKIQIKLPAAAADNPNFMLRIQQLNAAEDDFGYVDEVKLIGTPK